jgi:hypothetical protein
MAYTSIPNNLWNELLETYGSDSDSDSGDSDSDGTTDDDLGIYDIYSDELETIDTIVTPDIIINFLLHPLESNDDGFVLRYGVPESLNIDGKYSHLTYSRMKYLLDNLNMLLYEKDAERMFRAIVDGINGCCTESFEPLLQNMFRHIRHQSDDIQLYALKNGMNPMVLRRPSIRVCAEIVTTKREKNTIPLLSRHILDICCVYEGRGVYKNGGDIGKAYSNDRKITRKQADRFARISIIGEGLYSVLMGNGCMV